MCSGFKCFLALLLFASVPVFADDAPLVCTPDEIGALTWTPRSAEDVLRCDSGGFEPRDLSAGGQVAVRQVKLERSRNVVITGAEQVESIRWLDPYDNLSLLAQRRVNASAPLTVQVARVSRVLTFTWRDGSRRSVFIAPEADEIGVLKPPRGAEVLSFLGDRAVRPLRLRLTSGATSRTAPFERTGFASLPDVSPGWYAIDAEYRGNVVVRLADKVLLTSGQSIAFTKTRVPVAAALLIRMEPAVCEDLRDSRMTATLSPTGRTNTGSYVVDIPGDKCEAVVEGLAPASYEVRVAAAHGRDSNADSPVKLAPDRMSSIVVTPRYARIDGRLFLGSSPGRQLTLVFRGDQQSETVASDEDGYFSVTLEPGRYEVSVRSTELVPGAWKTIDVSAGRQTLELKFGGYRLSVRARASSVDLVVPVQIRVESDGTARAGIAMPPEHRAEFVGVPSGTYLITAAAPPDWESSGETKVTLDDITPEKEVEIGIHRAGTRSVRIVTAGGSPVAGARVRLGSLVLTEVQPGLYRADSSSGNTLRVMASGYLPLCRELAESERDVAVSVVRGPFSATFRIGRGESASARIVGMPGSNCAVFLSELEHRVTPSADGSQVVIDGLPAGQFTFISPDGTHTPFSAP